MTVSLEGHSKKVTFCPSIAGKHWVFPLTKVSASKVSAIQKKFVSKGSPNFDCTWQPGRFYVKSCSPTQKKVCNRLGILHKVHKKYFFPTNY